ncbi:DUF262 domain-containing protein [Candidatus Poribacteria bacterium]|nr:DUF262 domain-containing protein [Candidatus Poribacteria bacterium]MYA99328.1 DUF262 domain-containing protein [Candidatus Poribacteria bacterium]
MFNIQPKLLTFAQLLEKRLFRIPLYQRAYSWRRTERQDMFKDIQKLKERPGNSHFMATIVGLSRETVEIGTDEYNVIEIVDGQQRLTTLVILLKVIAKELKALLTDADAPTTDASLERELRELQELLVKPDALSLILLQTNHDRSQYFANFLRHGTSHPVSDAQTLADRELLRAIHECHSFVQRWKNPIQLLRILKNQLWFILHETKDVEAVYTVFEVLNNRGLEVSWLAKLKSRLMEVVSDAGQGNRVEHIEELHQIWGAFYGTVGLREGIDAEALRFAATLRYRYSIKKVLNEEGAVNALMNEVGTSTAKTVEISNWLLKVVNTVNQLQEEMRQPVTKIRHARLLAVSIILRDFPAEVERKLLDQWEKTSFRIFGLCRKDARTGVGDFVQLACEIQKNLDLSSDDISEKIRKIGAGNTIETAGDLLYNTDCYNGWEAELRYLLYRYEEHLAEQRGQKFDNVQWKRIWEESAVNSIEHILPQSKGSQYSWQNGIFVHRLGNLLLLPPRLNSELTDKDPQEKADDYRQTGLLIAGDVAEMILQEEGWGEADIESRENELLEWIFDEYDC